MGNQYFVTGTDTEVGKTMVSCAILEAAKSKRLSTLALKPIAAGCENYDGQWRNDDALALIKHMTVDLSYEQVNPVALKTPASPHIAADIDDHQLNLDRLVKDLNQTLSTPHDFALVEGAGGWRVPLSSDAMISDLAQALRLPVIMVVNLKLGCLNHAMLTAEAIKRDGLEVVAWVANRASAEPMAHESQNITTLENALSVPCLGALPFSQAGSPEELANAINLNLLG